DGYASDVILRSTSRDGVAWSAASVVLAPGRPGGWDGRHVCDPTVVTGVNIGGYSWAMWYTGAGPRNAVGIGTNRIGLALSHDGIHWDRQGVVVDCGRVVPGCLQ